MVYHGWNTYIQVCKEAELFSTFKNNWRFIKQVLRWTRNTWRSDFRSLFTERVIWRRHPFVAFTMVDKIFNPITLLSGPISVIVMAADGKFHLPLWDIIISYVVWLMMTRIVKLLPHLFKRPQDIIWVPAFLIFGYYFAVMKIYALFTLHEVGWGTRAGIDQTPAELKEEKEKQAMEQQKMEQDMEKQAHQKKDCASQVALCAAVAAAADQQRRDHMRPRVKRDIISRPDSPGSAELIHHFSRQQEQQRQAESARAAAGVGAGYRPTSRRLENLQDGDDQEVYEYNQDDELAQYFAQADANRRYSEGLRAIDRYGQGGSSSAGNRS
jgi:hypothetical protein